MGARGAMVQALEAGLDPEKVRVVPDPRKMGDTLPAQLDALVQVVLTSIEPTESMGQLQGNFAIWLVVPYSDPERGESPLESALDSLVELLVGLNWFHFSKAERSTYNDTWLAYKITGESRLTVEA